MTGRELLRLADQFCREGGMSNPVMVRIRTGPMGLRLKAGDVMAAPPFTVKEGEIELHENGGCTLWLDVEEF